MEAKILLTKKVFIKCPLQNSLTDTWDTMVNKMDCSLTIMELAVLMASLREKNEVAFPVLT